MSDSSTFQPLTMEALRKAMAALEKEECEPAVVLTWEEADRLTAADPTGRLWRPGDRYYRMGRDVPPHA